MGYHYHALNLTSIQSKYRAYLIGLTCYNKNARPVGFNDFPDGLYGSVEAFLQYYESGHCALDYDALIMYQEKQIEGHFRTHASQYRTQLANFRVSGMSKPSVPEAESPASS